MVLYIERDSKYPDPNSLFYQHENKMVGRKSGRFLSTDGLVWVAGDGGSGSTISSDFSSLYPALMKDDMPGLTAILLEWCKSLGKLEEAWVAANTFLGHGADDFLQIFMKYAPFIVSSFVLFFLSE